MAVYHNEDLISQDIIILKSCQSCYNGDAVIYIQTYSIITWPQTAITLQTGKIDLKNGNVSYLCLLNQFIGSFLTDKFFYTHIEGHVHIV